LERNKIKRMVGIALLIAIVVVLQLLGQFVKIGPASFALVLLPIVVGAAVYGPSAGAILGLAFSVVVLLQTDTAYFYGLSFHGTIITVLVKGTLAGWLAGLTYRAFAEKHPTIGVALAAVVCPLVNTGIFFLGCLVFFAGPLAATGIENVTMHVITVFIGINFIAEFFANVLCCPVIVRLLHAIKK